MTFKTPDGLDKSRFLKYLLQYGVAIIVVFIFSAIILHFSFNWRPILNARYKISHLIKREPFSEASLICELCWWIVYFAPYVLCIILGLFICINLTPKVIGVDILLIPLATMVFIFTMMNYSKNGHKLTLLAKISLGVTLLVYFVVTVVHPYIIPQKSWKSEALAIIWPSLWIHVVSMCIARLRMKTQEVSKTIESEKFEVRMLQRLGKGQIDQYTTITSGLNLIIRLGGTGVAAILTLGLNYKFINSYKSNVDYQYATVSTGILFIFLDALVLVCQNIAYSLENHIPMISFVLILKIITVFMASKYWILNQCIVFITLGVYFFTVNFQTIFDKIHGIAPIVENEYAVDQSILHAIHHVFEGSHMYKIFLRVVYLLFNIGTLIALITEIYVYQVKDEDPLGTYKDFELTQYWVIVSIIILSIFTSLVFAMWRTDNQYGMPTFIFNIFPIFLFFLIAIIMLSFMLGLHLDAYDLRVYVSVAWSFLMIQILLKRTFKLQYIGFIFTDFTSAFGAYWVYTLYTFVVLLLTILYFVFIFCYGNTKYISIAVYLVFIFLFSMYNLATQEDNNDYLKTFITLIVFLFVSGITLLVLAFVYFNWKYVLIIFGLILYGLSLFYAYCRIKRNKNEMSLTHLIVVCVSWFISFICTIIVAASGFFYFSHIVFEVLIVTLCFVMTYFFESKSFGAQASYIVTIVYTVAITISFIFKSKDAYYSITFVLFSLYFYVLLHTYRAINTTKKGYSIAVSEIFFPVNIYGNCHLEKKNSMSFCFSVLFYLPWIWGIITMTYTEFVEWGLVLQGIAFVIPFFLACSKLIDIDMKIVETMQFIEFHTLQHTVKSAIKTSCVDFHDNIEGKSFFTYDEFVRFVDNDTNADEQKHNYVLALKGQMCVSYDIYSNNIVGTIRDYLHKVNAKWDYIEKENFTVDEYIELFEVYKAVNNKNKSFKQEQNQLIQKAFEAQTERNKHHLHAIERYEKTSKYYDDMLNFMAKENVNKFEDPQLPPTVEPRVSDQKLFANSIWKRAEHFFSGPFIGEFRTDDITCGDVDDSYLMAVLSCLSRDKNVINELFKQPVKLERGIFAVHFNYLGKDIYSVVDSMIPIEGGFIKLSGPTSAASSAWFASIVEKAFSKISGGFSQMAGGFCSSAFNMLCDGYSNMIDLDSDNGIEMRENGEMFKLIKNTLENGGYVCASKFNPELKKQSSYAIYNSVEWKKFQMLRLRNPYNIDEDSVEMPKDSSKWLENKELRDLCHLSQHDDGTFWIPFTEFIYSFKFLYTFDRLMTSYLYEIKSSFKHDTNDGAHPYNENCPDMTHVNNISIRFKKPTRIKGVLERSGAQTSVKAYLTYNYGQPVSRIFVGREFRHVNLTKKMPMISFEWYIDRFEYPWTLTITRIAHGDPCDYRLRLYSDRDIEVDVLDISQFIDDYNINLPDVNIKTQVPGPQYNR